MRSHRHISPMVAMGSGRPFSPLDLNPLLLLDTQPVLRADPSIPMMTVRREPEGDEVEIYGYNPADPRQYQTSPGGAYVTTESLLFPTQRFSDASWYDQIWTSTTPKTINGWTNSGSIPFETLTQSGDDITSAINTATSGLAYAVDYFTPAIGEIYKVTYDCVLNSGDQPILALGPAGGTYSSTQILLETGSFTKYLVAITDTFGSRLRVSSGSGELSNFSLSNITLEKLDQSNAVQTTAAEQSAVVWKGATFGSELSSGNLTVGDDYEITANDDADFTTDGAPDSDVGTIFQATGTNVTLDAGDKVKEVLTWDYPVLKPDGTDDNFDTTIIISSASDYTLFVRLQQSDTTETLDYILDIQTGVLRFAYTADTADTAGYYDSAWRTATLSSTDMLNLSMILESSTSGRIQNGTSVIASGLNYTQKAIGGTVKLLSDISGNNNFGGYVQAVLLFDSGKTESQIAKLTAYYTP